jgi:hypothetical protein
VTGTGRLTGACLCGAVRFEVEPPLREILVCHCSLCRRSGSNAAAYTSVRRSALRLAESDGLATYIDVNDRERSFCCICGSSLFWAVAGSEWVSISAGALDGETGLSIAAHIYADSAADWEVLPHDLPAHREGSSSPLIEPSGG